MRGAIFHGARQHCLWEADRTLDREVARTLRTLAERYKRMSERSPQRVAYRQIEPQYQR
jgi:hypothetical protein